MGSQSGSHVFPAGRRPQDAGRRPQGGATATGGPLPPPTPPFRGG